MPGGDGSNVLPDALHGAAEDEDVVEDGQENLRRTRQFSTEIGSGL